MLEIITSALIIRILTKPEIKNGYSQSGAVCIRSRLTRNHARKWLHFWGHFSHLSQFQMGTSSVGGISLYWIFFRFVTTTKVTTRCRPTSIHWIMLSWEQTFPSGEGTLQHTGSLSLTIPSMTPTISKTWTMCKLSLFLTVLINVRAIYFEKPKPCVQ